MVGAMTPATSGTLTFTPDESHWFSVPITRDNIVESDETFNVTLSNPRGILDSRNPG